MLKFKLDVVAALKERGMTSYRLRKEKILGEQTLADLRHGIVIPGRIDWLCSVLDLQPGDLIEYVPDKEAGE